MELILLFILIIARLFISCWDDYKVGKANAAYVEYCRAQRIKEEERRERAKEHLVSIEAEQEERRRARDEFARLRQSVREAIEMDDVLAKKTVRIFIENKDEIASSLRGELTYVYPTDWQKLLKDSFCGEYVGASKGAWRAVYVIWLAKQGYSLSPSVPEWDPYSMDFGIVRQRELSREISRRVCKVVEMYMRDAHPELGLRFAVFSHNAETDPVGGVRWEHALCYGHEVQYPWNPEEARAEIEDVLSRVALEDAAVARQSPIQ